jgi:hypothetical protein
VAPTQGFGIFGGLYQGFQRLKNSASTTGYTVTSRWDFEAFNVKSGGESVLADEGRFRP